MCELIQGEDILNICCELWLDKQQYIHNASVLCQMKLKHYVVKVLMFERHLSTELKNHLFAEFVLRVHVKISLLNFVQVF